MNYSQLLEDVKDEVNQLFQHAEAEKLPYHNLSHTSYVLSKAAEIARHYELNDADFFIVETAAWFHDTGYLNGAQHDHEMRSAAIAEAFLQSKEPDAAIIQQVKDCILATRIPQLPQNLLQQIVCDADLFHLGTDNFRALNKKMKKEAEIHRGKKIEKEEWPSSTETSLFTNDNFSYYFATMLRGTKTIEIYNTQLMDNKFSEPVKVNGLFENDNYWKSSPIISTDGNYLIFNAYNTPLGQGGEDILFQ